MENWVSYVVAIAVGVVIGLGIVWRRSGEFKLDKRKLLEHCFGEAVYARSFSLSETRDWIKEREKLLKDGCKALVAKVNNETLKMLGKELKLDFDSDDEKYLVIVLVSRQDNAIKDSVLIKYEELNAQLEDALAKGNGALVVEG